MTEPMTDPWPFVPGVHHLEVPATDLLAAAADLAADETHRQRLVEAGQALLRDELTMRASLEAVLATGRVEVTRERGAGCILGHRSPTVLRSSRGPDHLISTVAPPIAFHIPDEPDIDGFVEDARSILGLRPAEPRALSPSASRPRSSHGSGPGPSSRSRTAPTG